MTLMLDEFPRKAKLIQILGKYFPCIVTVIVESVVLLICSCFDTERSYVKFIYSEKATRTRGAKVVAFSLAVSFSDMMNNGLY